MKNITRIILLALVCYTTTHSFTGKSFMTYRSQGQNLARNIAGWQSLRTDIFNGHASGNLSIAVEYGRSFHPGDINKYFFGGNCMTFSGSRVPYRGACDIMADYFGLPTDFQSTISVDPRIRNVVTDFDFYWNLDCWIKGLNLHINIPVTSTRWALNPCEKIIDPGTAAYPAGYMSNALMERDTLKNGALDILSGGKPVGDIIYPLLFGRLDVCEQHNTKIADILVALGYTFVRDRSWLIGANIQVVGPTGTYSRAYTLFEPQIGNGHHWAFGGGLTARYDIIDNLERDLKLSVCLDASIQHLFKTKENRSYDLTKNGPGSRYILLQDMVSAISQAQGFDTLFPTQVPLENQYITRLIYAINETTLVSDIKINVQADVVAKLTMDYRNFNFDLGYNFWGRSHETLVNRECFNHKYYGVKGDAQVYGFFPIGPDSFLSIPGNATQSNATIHAGQGDGNTTHNFINANADNAALMYNATSPLAQTNANSFINTGITSFEQINGSNQAIILTDADINDCSGLSPRAYTHKVFGSAAYTWRDCNHVTPYVSLGAEGEFAGSDDCVKTAISQWGVWVKGGFNY
jgi:hypothetical protein